MVEKHFCDIPNCNEEAYKLDIEMCSGYYTSSKNYSTGKKIIYEPYERPTTKKYDLCDKHFKEWCNATYTIIKENVEND